MSLVLADARLLSMDHRCFGSKHFRKKTNVVDGVTGMNEISVEHLK